MVSSEAIRELSEIGLDGPVTDESFDRFARLVHRHLGVPIALVSFVLDAVQITPGVYGLPASMGRRFPLSRSLCATVVEDAAPLIVTDTRTDGRPTIPPGLGDLGVVAYAGFPLFDSAHRVLGALCAIDSTPRQWTDAELASLADLAAACTSELRLRVARAREHRLQNIARQASKRSRLLLRLSESFAVATSVGDVVDSLAGVGRMIGARWIGLAHLDPGGRSMTYAATYMEPRLTPSFRKVRLDEDRPSAWVARTREPLFFSNIDMLTTQFPAAIGASDDDAKARAFLPVVHGTTLLGVVMLAWDIERDFDEEARKTEMAIASYLAHALDRVKLLEERHRAAMTLQNAMLSPLPHVRHLDLGFVYTPAAATDQVGGDWYDAVSVDDDTCIITIGDVTGHDMLAAAQMGQLRSMLRTFAWSQDVSPSNLLRLLDNANDKLGVRATGTAVVARLDRVDDATGAYNVTWSNAGHLPPFVLRADGSVERCHDRPDIMLGVVPDSPRHDFSVILNPGDTIVLYTDGLVELRGAEFYERLADLHHAMSDLGGIATGALPEVLVRRMVSTGGRDDVAVLAARVRHGMATDPGSGTPICARLDVPTRATAIGTARRWVDDIVEEAGAAEEVRRTIMLLTSELVTNAIHHAIPPVRMSVQIDERTVRVEVSDGSAQRPVLRSPAPHELSGRGVQFLEHRADRWGVIEHDARAAVAKTVWFEIGRYAQ